MTPDTSLKKETLNLAIIDDNEYDRISIYNKVKKSKFSSFIKHTYFYETLEESLINKDFDLIITDGFLAGSTGEKLIKDLRENNPLAFIIYTSGVPQSHLEQNKKRYKEAGADVVVSKDHLNEYTLDYYLADYFKV